MSSKTFFKASQVAVKMFLDPALVSVEIIEINESSEVATRGAL